NRSATISSTRHRPPHRGRNNHRTCRASAGAPFDVKATRDGPTGASVLEEVVEAVMGPFSHCHGRADEDAIQSARRSLTESDVGGRANTVPSTPAVVASSPLPPMHGGAGGFRRRRS